MRLIDADELLGMLSKGYETRRALDLLPTVDPWHYPSKGEFPTEGEEVLCLLWGTTPDVGCWNEKDELWHFDEFEEETVDCWQYIEPPKEER